MATYKLIQDIEAEDHILGPLSLRQFIFALIAVFMFYMSFYFVSKHLTFMLAIFLPPGLFFAFFAVPFGRDQPTEIWFLAKLRFWFKPRKRIWDQSGVKELVTITAPKVVEPVRTDGLSQYEVKSRLSALANTLDSRGWVVKNSSAPSAAAVWNNNAQVQSDRIVDVENDIIPEETPVESDILENSNPIARQFDSMITQTSAARRQELINQMNAPAPATTEPASMSLPAPVPSAPAQSGNNQWFMPHVGNGPQPVYAADVSAQNATPEEAALAAKLRAQHDSQQIYFGNLRTIQPLGAKQAQQPASSWPQAAQSAVSSLAPATDMTNRPQQQTGQTGVVPDADPVPEQLTEQPDPAILSLANNNDFTVETLAREAKRAKGEDLGEDEVVISLH